MAIHARARTCVRFAVPVRGRTGARADCACCFSDAAWLDPPAVPAPFPTSPAEMPKAGGREVVSFVGLWNLHEPNNYKIVLRLCRTQLRLGWYQCQMTI